MKDMLLFRNKEKNKLAILFILTLVSLLGSASLSQGQFPFSKRNTWDGPYDIKMIAAPNLEPAYLNPAQAASGKLKVDSLIKYSTILMSGTLLDINNRYKGGNPFVQLSGLTQQAVSCPDYNSPCMAGIPTQAPNSSCPVRYTNPTVLPDVYVSMTYPDYDTDMSTYSSSMAQLDISQCSEIEAAYLYWTGMFQGSNPAITLSTPTKSYNGTGSVFNTSTSSGYQTVKFKRPGGTYQNVTAPAGNIRNDGTRYLCVADVTTLVQGTGGGQFWVANLQSYPNEGDGGSSSGWVLVVVFRSPLSPPRLISLWDGLEAISSGDSRNFVLTGLQAPATNNFKSYVGFAVLDGENLASQIGSTAPEGLGFQTNNGGSLFDINPFKNEQPYRKAWTKKGYPAQCDGSDNIDNCKKPLFDANWCSVYDGISSSHITSYSDVNGKNGNEIVRLPSLPNTLGLDAHHVKLPNGAVAPGATQATLTVKAGPQGGTTPFMAYVAIERLQPKLEMTKTADKNSTALNTQITYTLRIKNLGNDKSLGGDIVYDTLDVATNYVAGSLTSKRYLSGVATTPAPGVSLVSSAGNNLQIKLANSILPGDSVDLIFKVQVKDYASAQSLWDIQCKRSILNTAYIQYNTITSGILQSKSNSNDCGIGSETRILLFDAQLGASTVKPLGPIDACSYIHEEVIPHVRSELMKAGVSSTDVTKYDIRDASYNRIRPDEVFFSDPNTTMSYFAIRDYNTSGNCQEIYELKFNSCVLPVEWISFTGWREDDSNILTWITATEKDNDYFVIERSTNGRDYTPIGSLPGTGTSTISHVYRFVDSDPLNGVNYYRIRQVDYDGKSSYSSIIAVHSTKAEIDIYPNPNQGSFTIRMIAPEQAYRLDITDMTGKSVYYNTGNIVPKSIEVNDLAKGIYIVRFYFGNNSIVEKMMVY